MEMHWPNGDAVDFNKPRVTIAAVGVIIARRGEPVMLCTAALLSYPPQCAGGIEVRGVDPADVPTIKTDHGVSWTDERVMVVGHLDDYVLVADRPVTACHEIGE